MIHGLEFPTLLVACLTASLGGHESSESSPDPNLDEPDDEGAELS